MRRINISKQVEHTFLFLFKEWTPIMYTQYPGGFATKCYIHYGHCVKNGGKFVMFDYGSKQNLRLYGSPKPPEYPLKNISVPIYLVYGTRDSLSTVRVSLYISESEKTNA